MTWTEYFVETLPNAKTVASPDGKPYISMEVAPREYVEIHMVIVENNSCPFQIVFRHFDQIGGLLEEREYGQAGTKDLARQIALATANLRLNSHEFVLDGE